MTEPRIVTAVTLTVPTEREHDLLAGFHELVADGPRPDGFLRTELLRSQDGRWVIQTLWRDRSAILAARQAGMRPGALDLAERVGAEHTHDLLTVQHSSDAPRPEKTPDA